MSSNSSNYYTALGLKQNCTQAEIKQAYFSLSKQVHPDSNDGKLANSSKKFIEISEAYNVLSKPSTRVMYDQHLKRLKVTNNQGIYTNAPHDRIIFYDSTLDHSKYKRGDQKNKSYYGTRFIKSKLPNGVIASAALVFMLFGGLVHYYVAMKSSNYVRMRIEERDKIAFRNLAMAEARGKRGGEENSLAREKFFNDLLKK